jgi:hypothetical protein
VDDIFSWGFRLSDIIVIKLYSCINRKEEGGSTPPLIETSACGFCVEKVRIEALKGKIFNFNENKVKSQSVPECLWSY